MKRYKRKMKVIVIAQQKGGVGKTTTCRNLADYFARYRHSRVLLIDFDAQGNLSFRYLPMEKHDDFPKSRVPPVHPDFDPDESYDDGWNGRSSSADIFMGVEAVPYPTRNPLIHILPCDGHALRQAERDLPENIERKVVNRLFEFLSYDEVIELYDIVLIDTGPNRQALTQSALRAATHIMIPLKPEKQNMETLSDMIDFWREENGYRHEDDSLELIGLMPNLVKNTALHQGVLRGLKNDPGFSDLITPFYISDRTAIAEADHEASDHQSVFDLRPDNKARLEMIEMCHFVENRVFGDISEVK